MSVSMIILLSKDGYTITYSNPTFKSEEQCRQKNLGFKICETCILHVDLKLYILINLSFLTFKMEILLSIIIYLFCKGNKSTPNPNYFYT